ncbi:hypothetical protein J6590_021095 [Homalodisca vitripennis]|nr:hypothetical protein J6590_021095 [Homalodisca vitripennis]
MMKEGSREFRQRGPPLIDTHGRVRMPRTHPRTTFNVKFDSTIAAGRYLSESGHLRDDRVIAGHPALAPAHALALTTDL